MKISKKQSEIMYFVFRVVVGIFFFMHGATKFGWFTTMPEGIMLAAGLIEVIVGVCVVFGIVVRYAAILGAIQMLIAYGIGHAPQGLSPLDNGGELALLFMAAFLALAAQGNGRWNLEKTVLGKEL